MTAPDPRRARPRRLGLAALAAALPLVLYVALVGLSDPAEVQGAALIEWVPPPGVDPARVEAAISRRREVRVRRTEDALLLEVPFADPDAIDLLARRLTEEPFGMHVVEVADEMRALGLVLQVSQRDDGALALEEDTWSDPASGRLHRDHYLAGDRRTDLEAAFARAEAAGWSPPPGARIAYQRLETAAGTRWRSYLIESTPELAGAHIAEASAQTDPQTNRPVVQLDFTDEGRTRFAELTGRIRGAKLAIVVGDEVQSAPVISDAVTGGRAVITMGGGDPREQRRDRDLLVAMLRTGPLPPGGTLRTVTHTTMQRGGGLSIQRLAGVVGIGVLVVLLAWAFVRRAA